MATGVTSSITSNVSYNSKYQLTTEDDFLTIRGATVTLLSPQGEIFTREGDDTVQVEDSLIDAKADNLQFFLGDGNDKLTARNATFSAPIKTGNGNDIVIANGKIRLNKQLFFGSGNDTLELLSVLENAGGIDFGTDGIKTLRFNGGSLAPVSGGTISDFTKLDVTYAGGTTGSDLTLSGSQTSITLNGDLSGSGKVFVSGGTTTLSAGNNVRTTVGLSLSQMNLVQAAGGSLEFSGCGIKADDSTVSVHDIVVSNGSLTGRNTAWTFENADFSNGCIKLSEGSLDFRNMNFANRLLALSLSGISMSGTRMSLIGNGGSSSYNDYGWTRYNYFGAMVASNADVNIVDFRANNNSGTAVIQSGGAMILTSATFSGNEQKIEWDNGYAGYYAQGGGICCVGGFLTLNSATFSGNLASAGYGKPGTGTAGAYGGAVFLSGAVANMENVQFVDNRVWATGNNDRASSFNYGGAIYLAGNATINYVVTSGKQITNSRNRTDGRPNYDSNGIVSSSSRNGGGWLYLAGGNANITVETGGKLIIGDDTGYDSIEGTSGNRITKLGSGYMLVNSYIDDNKLQWSVSEGTLELAKYSNGMLSYSTGKWFGRTIHLDNWTIGTNGKLVLSVLDDTIDMGKSKRIDGVIDLGGGKDAINTSGYDLNGGTILFGDLTIDGGGRIGSQLRNRSATEGSSLTLKSVGLDSKFYGNACDDVITVYGNSSLGDVDMGGGVNSVQVMSGSTLSADKFKLTQGGRTTVYVYLGSTLSGNSLTVCSDENAARDTLLLDWSDQTDLDKVRILVSRDPSAFRNNQYEFAVELYNRSKSFTLNLQKGYYIQFQAQDEDGWKQRLLTDTTAPDRVTGVRFDGSVLRWDEAQDNPGGNGVKQYRVEISQDASFSTVWQSRTVTGTEYALSSIPETVLYFRVSAEDCNGNVGAWSETVSGMNDLVPPTVPAGGNETVDGYSVTLSWSASTDGGSGVQRYEWRIASDSAFGQIVKSGNTGDCSVSVDNLKYGTYYWSVRAADASGNIGDWSGSRSFSTVDGIAPGTPGNVSFSIRNGKTLSASWSAVRDDVSGSGLKGYEFQLATDSAFNNLVQSMTVTSPEAVAEDLANATYYIRVRSVDYAGNRSVWTETESFLIDRDDVPPTIRDIRADITDQTKENVTVTAVFSDDVALAQALYSIGDTVNWKRYVNGVTVTENAVVYFRAVDSAGNMAEASYAVNNIEPKPSSGLVLANESRTVGAGQPYTSTTITSGGRLTVLSDGVASATTISRGGVMYVSGGTADQTDVRSGGSLVMDWGELTGRTVIEQGAVVSMTSDATCLFDLRTVAPGNTALVTNLSLIRGAPSYEIGLLPGQAEGVYVLAEGAAGFDKTITVSEIDSVGEYWWIGAVGVGKTDGPANFKLSLIDDRLVLRIGEEESPVVSGLVLTAGTRIVSSGGTYVDAVVNADGSLIVSDGGKATATTVNSGGLFQVRNGGSASGTVVYSGGEFRVSGGGTATSTTVADGGCFYIFNGAAADGVDVASNGEIHVSKGGRAAGVTVSSRGRIKIGGRVNNLTMLGGAGWSFEEGGIVDGVTFHTTGKVSVKSGTSVLNIRETGVCYVEVQDGAVASFASNCVAGITVSGGKSATIHSGTTANNVALNGNMVVFSSGSMNGASVNESGSLDVLFGGRAAEVQVNSGGLLRVSGGGAVTGIRENGGYVSVDGNADVSFSSAVISQLTLSENRSASIHASTTASGVSVRSAGRVDVFSGGRMTGRMTFQDGAVVSAYAGAVLDFDLTQTYPDFAALVNDLSLVSGTPSCTLTVNSDQTFGTYRLAEGAAAFDGTITVVNPVGTRLGTLAVGQTAELTAGREYALTLANGCLSVTIQAPAVIPVDTVAPTVSNLAADITEKTGGNVTVTAVFSDDVELARALYSIGDTVNWKDYVNGVTVTENTTVYFKAVDSAGNESELASYEVTNIDKPAPSGDPKLFFPGDFSGDGGDMLAVQSRTTIDIYANKTLWSTLSLTDGWSIAGIGDFDGDGADDLLRVHASGLVIGEMSNGDGTFAPRVLNLRSEGWDILGTGDFDGDGTDDVLIANPTGASDTVGLLGYWKSGTEWTLINGYSPEWECVSTGDFNGDGRCDMLWRNSFTGEGGLTYNAYCTWIVDPPAGQSDWRMVSVANPAEWNFLCSGDFDGNGSHDIAMINGEGVVGIWGVADGYLSSWSILSAVDASAWELAGVGDFNGDGTDDIAWRQTSTGQTGFWQINDKTLTIWQSLAVIQ